MTGIFKLLNIKFLSYRRGVWTARVWKIPVFFTIGFKDKFPANTIALMAGGELWTETARAFAAEILLGKFKEFDGFFGFPNFSYALCVEVTQQKAWIPIQFLAYANFAVWKDK